MADWFSFFGEPIIDSSRYTFLQPSDTPGQLPTVTEPTYIDRGGYTFLQPGMQTGDLPIVGVPVWSGGEQPFSFGVPPLNGAGDLPVVDLARALETRGIPSPTLTGPATGTDTGTTGGATRIIQDPSSGKLYAVGADGRVQPIQVLTDPQTGETIAVGPGGQQVLLTAEQNALLRQYVQRGDAGGIARLLEPINRVLGTPLGGTLAALGLGAIGIGLSRAVAGGTENFQAPARTQTTTSTAFNPVAQDLEQDIRMRNLEALKRLAPPANATVDAYSASADPITADLAARLRKAFAGEISNPILERANTRERNELEAKMLRRTGGSPLWQESSGGIEATNLMNESQAIRQYLDNMQTIAQLEPRVASRQSAETQRLADLSGLGTMDAQRRYEDALATQLAYNEYLTDRQDQVDLARGVSQLFGTAAAGVTGGTRKPWDRQYVL